MRVEHLGKYEWFLSVKWCPKCWYYWRWRHNREKCWKQSLLNYPIKELQS